MSASEDEPVSMDEVDCPACKRPPIRFPRSIIDVDGEWWHTICLLREHHQVEKRDEKPCPDCGAASAYRPITRPPEGRFCPNCGLVFPEDTERRDDIEVELPRRYSDDAE